MKKNIVLTGLMGCGKTTVGKEISRILGMPFIDIDEDIEKHFGSINELFEKSEMYFRDIETSRIKILSKKEGVVISTGGGSILRPENMEALKTNGLIFYINRTVEDIIKTINTSNRPLLKNGADVLYSLYNERKHLYLEYSDYVIDASILDKAVSEIISICKNNFQIKHS